MNVLISIILTKIFLGYFANKSFEIVVSLFGASFLPIFSEYNGCNFFNKLMRLFGKFIVVI